MLEGEDPMTDAASAPPSRWDLWQQALRQGGSREASEMLFDRLLIEHGYEKEADVQF